MFYVLYLKEQPLGYMLQATPQNNLSKDVYETFLKCFLSSTVWKKTIEKICHRWFQKGHDGLIFPHLCINGY